MARFTESGALTGARATLPRSRASLPGIVGPEEGNEPAKLTPGARTKNAANEMSFRTGIFTRLSISVCYASGMSQKIAETYSTNFLQCTGAQCCRRLPLDAIGTGRKSNSRCRAAVSAAFCDATGDAPATTPEEINFSAAEARRLFPQPG